MRSDTVTQPTAAMREVMARAEVGDDVYGGDPSVRALEERTAELLGKEDAVYMPTGTMTNQVALRCHARAGDQILTDVSAHLHVLEGGGPSVLSALTVKTLPGERGIFTAEDVDRAIPPVHRFNPGTMIPTTTLLCVENTHNVGGGTVWPIEGLQEVTSAGRRHGLALHLDGARLWNASVASGVPEREVASLFDTVSVCFSKGLGAPIGSALAGAKETIDRARREKQLLGGGFRQAGIIAAAALHALEHHRERLSEDHRHAKRLAVGLAEMPGIELDPDRVETNIVRFRLQSKSSFDLAEKCHQAGVHILPSGVRGIRAVTHLGISSENIDRALQVLSEALAKAA